MNIIETARLRLIPCDDTIFDAIKMGDRVLAQVIGVNVPKKWTESREAFFPAYDRWKAHPPLRDWWTYLIVSIPDRLLIGSCGFKGEPDQEGIVEIGYEIKSSYRGKGFATEAAVALAGHAFLDEAVRKVIAHTLPFENPSTAVLRKAGFEMETEVEDDAEGRAWRWEKGR